MADEMDGVDLECLHQNIQERFQAQFPQFKLIEFYREEEERRPPSPEQLPALFLALSEFELDIENDMGSEQLPLIARFEARVIDTFDQDNAKLKIRTLTTQLAYYIFKNKRFHISKDCMAGPAVLDAIEQDNFSPELDRYKVWRIDFSVQINIGDNIWKQEGQTPIPVFNYAPVIGTQHLTDYQGLNL